MAMGTMHVCIHIHAIVVACAAAAAALAAAALQVCNHILHVFLHHKFMVGTMSAMSFPF